MGKRTDRRCAWCAGRFTPKRIDTRTCSALCRGRHNTDEQNAKGRIHHSPRSCVGCRLVFTPQRSDCLACSPECWRKLTYERRDSWHANECERCGKAYRAKRSDARFCGARCSQSNSYDSALASARAAKWSKDNPERRRVIRMRDKLNRRATQSASVGVSNADWLRTFKRYEGRCAYCEAPAVHMEHVVPLSRGGKHQIGNVVPACAPCNLSKHSRFIVEWRYARRHLSPKE